MLQLTREMRANVLYLSPDLKISLNNVFIKLTKFIHFFSSLEHIR